MMVAPGRSRSGASGAGAGGSVRRAPRLIRADGATCDGSGTAGGGGSPRLGVAVGASWHTRRVTEPSDSGPFADWAIVELMGHRRLAGWLTEQDIAGRGFLRLDVPCDPPATQLYSPAAVYCITPTSEAVARVVAKTAQPAPVQRWELPAVVDDADDAEGPF